MDDIRLQKDGSGEQVTAPYSAVFCWFTEKGEWRRRESKQILALSPIQQNRMESHFPAPLLNLTNPPSPPAYHPHTIQMPSA